MPSKRKKKVPFVSHVMSTGPWTEAELPKAVSVLFAVLAPLLSASDREAVDSLGRAEAAALCSGLSFGDGGALAEAAAGVVAATRMHGLATARAGAAAKLTEAAAAEPTTHAVPKRVDTLAAALPTEPPAAAATLLSAAAELVPPPLGRCTRHASPCACTPAQRAALAATRASWRECCRAASVLMLCEQVGVPSQNVLRPKINTFSPWH